MNRYVLSPLPTTTRGGPTKVNSPSRRECVSSLLVVPRPVIAVMIAIGMLWSFPMAASADPALLPTEVTAQTSAARITLGTKVTVSGTVSPPDLITPRTVILQFKTGTGWRQLGRGSTDNTGAYTLRVPTDWYGQHVLRVVAPATTLAGQGVSASRTVTVRPKYDPRGTSSAWRSYPNKARWNPCAVIPFRTNLRHAPKGTLDVVKRAFKIVHAATGLRFAHAGGTTKVPFSGGSTDQQFLSNGLVIAWTTPKIVGGLAGTTAGVGGSTSRSTNGGPWRYVYGGVAIDATQRLEAKGFRKGKSTGALLLHEIAHAIGLIHVAAKSQMMYPSLLSSHRAKYEAGDLAGLRAVGASKGCF